MSGATLTRAAQAIEIIKAGGRVSRRSRPPWLFTLRDAHGVEVPAWQQAIASAVKTLGIEPAEDKS